MADRERVCVFLDYHNVFRQARRRFRLPGTDSTDGQVDPLELGRLIAGRRTRPSLLQQVGV